MALLAIFRHNESSFVSNLHFQTKLIIFISIIHQGHYDIPRRHPYHIHITFTSYSNIQLSIKSLSFQSFLTFNIRVHKHIFIFQVHYHQSQFQDIRLKRHTLRQQLNQQLLRFSLTIILQSTSQSHTQLTYNQNQIHIPYYT